MQAEKWPRPWKVGEDYAEHLAILDALGDVVVNSEFPSDKPFFEIAVADHNAIGNRNPEAIKNAVEWMLDWSKCLGADSVIGLEEGLVIRKRFDAIVLALREGNPTPPSDEGQG